MAFKLKRLVIKPILACTAGCPSCSLRLDLYKQRQEERELSCAHWIQVIRESFSLGCRDFHISGGEPMLYPHLGPLVQTAASLGMHTNINTNGSRVTPDLVKELEVAGLEAVTISLYSRFAQVNDRMRVEEGLFDRAIHSLRHIKEKSGIRVDLQTILGRENLLDLGNYLRFACDLGVSNVYLSFVEGAMDNPWLPDAVQIIRFREEVLPVVREIIRGKTPLSVREKTLRKVNGMFPAGPERELQYARGQYFPGEKPGCPRPYNFALILSTGEVHPCNGVEYAHEPIMGNVLNDDLTSIWKNKKWALFRKERHNWCHQCPVTLHFHIPLAEA